VLAARIEKVNREGRNAFLECQLPEAVITLKQGAGRLIRDEADRGVLMLCDPRLISRGYGRRILQSLPPMRFTRIAADATAFFSAPANPLPGPPPSLGGGMGGGKPSATPAKAPSARTRE
jgi:ATP-dependent DNA helicase DinG